MKTNSKKKIFQENRMLYQKKNQYAEGNKR